MDSAIDITATIEPVAMLARARRTDSHERTAREGDLQPPPSRRRARCEDPAPRFSAELARTIGPKPFRMWFSQARLEVSPQRVKVIADTPFVARWIDSHFGPALKRVAADVLGDAVEIDISVAPEAAAADRRDAQDGSCAEPASSARGRGHDDDQATNNDQRHASTIAAPRSTAAASTSRGSRLHSLDEFVVGASNRLAHAAACRLADGDDLHGLSPLFIHGDCGVGKTHLLQGVCRRFIERSGKSAGVRYVTGEQFTNEFIAALRTNAIDAFRNRVRRLSLLAIDDVHFLANKIKTQSEFQCTLDAIDFGGARVVMASDNHPHHIKRFSQSLVSRFVSGMVVRIERPDRELRCALIRRLAERRGLRLGDAAVEELASNGGASVRELEGALTRLAAWRAIAQPHQPSNDIGLLLVQQVLSEDRVRPNRIVRIATVLDAVCQRLSVAKADLLGSGRHRRVVVGRSMVAYLARELTTLSFPEIAQALGRENHSTVHTADQRLRRQLLRGERLDVAAGDSTTSLRELADLLRRDICRAGD